MEKKGCIKRVCNSNKSMFTPLVFTTTGKQLADLILNKTVKTYLTSIMMNFRTSLRFALSIRPMLVAVEDG